MGLEMPYSRWMRGPLNAFVGRILDRDRVQQTELLRPEGVAALLNDHITMRVDNGRALWGLISWVLWHEQCIQPHSTS